MAALPPKEEGDEEGAMDADAPLKEEPESKANEARKEVKGAQGQGKGGEKGGGGGAGGGAKKKKGKR